MKLFIEYFIGLLILNIICLTHVWSQETYCVGIYDNRPLCFVNSEGEAQGVYIDILNHIASLESWTINYIHKPWNDLLNQLNENKVDFICGIAYSPDRAQTFNFNKENIIVDWGQIILPRNSNIQSIIDLNNKKIATVEKGILLTALKRLLKQFDLSCQFVEVTSAHDVFTLVEKGTVHAGTVLHLSGLPLIPQFDVVPTPIVFEPLQLRFASKVSNNASPFQTIDHYLNKYKQDQNSIYYQCLNNWYSVIQSKTKSSWLTFSVFFLFGFMIIFFIFFIKYRRVITTQDIELTYRNKELNVSISKHKETEKALAMSENRFRAITTHALDSIFIKDDSRKYCFVNPAMLQFFNCKEEDIIGKKPEDLFDAHSAAIINSVDDRSFNGENVNEIKSLIINNQKKVFHTIQVPMEIKEGKVVSISGIVRDITDMIEAQEQKEKLEAQLFQAHKLEAIGTLAGGIAHDFNNILSIILGNIELAQDSINLDHDDHQYLNEASSACIRAKELVQQILQSSRKGHPEKIEMMITPLMKELIKLLRASLPKSIEIESNVYTDSELILGNPTQIHQVLLNLCTNAAQSMENGGTLTIDMKRTTLNGNTDNCLALHHLPIGDYVMISIHDTGCGIDQNIMDRIFDPYFTTKEIGKGSGIGLALVYGIVKNHNGAVTVDSTIGQGSVFNVYFPLISQNDNVENKHMSESSEYIPTGNERVLIIDDEIMILDFLKILLEKLGYHVECLKNPLEALQVFKNNPLDYDLVLTDLSMPHLSGTSLSTELLSIRPDIPIILCTGFNETVSNTIITEIGIKKLLVKPLTKKQLAQGIRDVLDNQ